MPIARPALFTLQTRNNNKPHVFAAPYSDTGVPQFPFARLIPLIAELLRAIGSERRNFDKKFLVLNQYSLLLW
jgi:hypothetical protein